MAEVDCTTKQGNKLCEFHDIHAFPTIKYGDPHDLQDYTGAHTYESMSKFAKENLVPLCSPTNLDLCKEEMKGKIEKYMAMSPEELDDLVIAEEKKLSDARNEFDAGVAELQNRYSELEEERKEKIAQVRNGDLGLIKSVSTHAKKKTSKPDGKDEL